MKTMDGRMAARRRTVSEDRARRRLRWLLGLLALATLVLVGAWLIRSPILSIRTITVTGASHSTPAATAATAGLTTGTATISVNAAALEVAIVSDPWIAHAEVVVTWPGSVEIHVVEHEPVAVLATVDGAYRISVDGAVLDRVEEAAGPTVATARSAAVGVTLADPAVLGALRFLATLPPPLARSALLDTAAETLTGWVDDHPVRLGRPVEMKAKALALVAVLESGVAPGATVDLIAPRRPAVSAAQPQVDGEVTAPPNAQPSD